MVIPVDAGTSTPPTPVALLIPETRRPAPEAPHGSAITDLAVTADGTAAITSDDLGGHRLWPALDGSLEPRAIELPAPAQLAIARDPQGFAIAMIDEAGGLVLQLTDREGALRQRATLPLEPTFKGIAFTTRGLLAWRSDQQLLRLAMDGTTTAELATEPGQRVLQIAVPASDRSDRAIAVIEGATDTMTWRRARFLNLGDKLAWGPWIPIGDEVDPSLVVSPELTRLAYLTHATPPKLVVHDVGDGTQLLAKDVFNAVAVELPDPNHVVYAANGQTVWLDLTSDPPVGRNVMITQITRGGVLASGGGKSFNPNGGELVISDAAGSKYLGYGLQLAQLATAAGEGELAISYGDRAAVLDDQLRARPLDLFPRAYTLSALRHVTGQTWLAQATRPDRTQHVLAVVNGAARSELSLDQPAGQLTYDPASRLVGVAFSPRPEVYRLAGDRLEVVASYPKPPPYERVGLTPVSSKTGTQVVVAHSKDTTTVRWASDPRALDKGPSYVVDGAVAAVDVTGKVYAWTKGAKGTLELAILAQGTRVGTLAVDKDTRGIWPDRTGERVLVSHAAGLTLYRTDGSAAWTRPLSGVVHVVWTSDHSIVATTGLGVVRLDDQGALQVMRCGWLFELATQPHQPRVRSEPMCTRRG